MKPVKTANSNHSFGSPEGLPEGVVGDLPCQMVDDEIAPGVESTFVRSVWQLSDEEREQVAAGALIELELAWLGVMPPVALSVTDEQALPLEAEAVGG